MGKHNRPTQGPVEPPKPAEALAVEPVVEPPADVAEAAPPSPAPKQPVEPEDAVDARGNVECEALSGIMHNGQIMPPGSKFSLERQLFRRLKKSGHVRGVRQD